MIALIAGIVALDPLGATSTEVVRCQVDGIFTCDEDRVVLLPPTPTTNESLSFVLQNQGATSYVLENVSLYLPTSNGSRASWTAPSLPEFSTYNGIRVDGGDEHEVNISSDEFAALSNENIIDGEYYTYEFEVTYYPTRQGSGTQYTQQVTGRIQTPPTR
jgi:hypothetical protein